jgi:hypothetical protein
MYLDLKTAIKLLISAKTIDKSEKRLTLYLMLIYFKHNSKHF